ncbi:DUF6443 domain-containing protein [Aureisphaera galaxeae]|uniref:DUF6443 domain-containing protein n=1 Tax=Aureisphaera galaxeae TaxID=1538023 RepID=UPI00234FB7CA|nr:DUF6443 domain-containing protein [Aureisphaera galaxeae]MDC8002502.1 DUF6443 domain-containing protein [Aureisphaera galaxeae]
MKYIIVTLFLSVSFLSLAQTSDENYVKSTTYRVETPDGNVADNSKIESITYHDGLGRPKQTIALREGGNRQDLVTPITYDALGRQRKEFLPYANPNLNNDGAWVPNVVNLLAPQYLSKFSSDSDGSGMINPYSESVFENSPLNRLQEQGAPGMDWVVDTTDNDHTIKYVYDVNFEENIYKFDVDFAGGLTVAPVLAFDGWFGSGELFETIVKDENWKPSDGNNRTTVEFTNQLGQVLLKRTFNFDGYTQLILNTYYIYDDFGNLTFVLPPMASKDIVENSSMAINAAQILGDFAYQYKYDERNRLIEKKLPGKGWEHIVYDKLDRVVLTQDVNQRSMNKWLFTKYDDFNRAIYTGIYASSDSRSVLQAAVNASQNPNETRASSFTDFGGVPVYYSNNAFPNNTSQLEVLTIDYFDTYDPIPLGDLSLPLQVYGVVPAANTKGLPTISKIKVLDTNHWITELMGYDDKGRIIYTAKQNEFLETIDVVESRLDFTGNVETSTTTHAKDGNATISIKDYFSYDHRGRLLTHLQETDNRALELIASNQYDEYGQLANKKVGGQLFELGYTDEVHVNVSPTGLIYKTDPTDSYNAGLATQGVLDFNGGVRFMVPHEGRYMRLGLSESNTSPGVGDLDYFMYFFVNGNQTPIFRGYARNPSTGGLDVLFTTVYSANDTFAIEWDGFYIKYIHNDTEIAVYSQIVSPESFVGDLSFRSADSSVQDFELYASSDITKFLQKVDYRYNIRGWLTDINNVNDLIIGEIAPLDLFNFRINYTSIEGASLSTNSTPDPFDPLYNGNIAQTIWKTANTDNSKRTYAYLYDDLNRIIKARNRTGNDLEVVDPEHTYNLWGVSYDQNGNIKQLKRSGKYTSQLYDDLSYTYSGNQLLRVDENSTATHKDLLFKDDTSPLAKSDYSYDSNGNMKSDLNKGIATIVYNHLNLPTSVHFDPVNLEPRIDYVYDANGTKMSKTLVDNGIITTQYAGGFIYNDQSGVSTLQFITQPEGYVAPTPVVSPTGGETTYSQFKYAYQYKDHLGNVRLSYIDDNTDGSIDPANEIIEESNYFPFGLRHWGYNDSQNGLGNSFAQQRKFGGKEFQEELDLDWYDIAARNYDPALGRWMNIDPLAEEMRRHSPYNYAFDNPIYFMDPDGMAPLGNMAADWIKNGDGTYTAEAGDSAASLAMEAGISLEEANALVQGQLGANYIGKDGKIKSNVEVGDVIAIPDQVEEAEIISINQRGIEKAVNGINADAQLITDLYQQNDSLDRVAEKAISQFELQREAGVFEGHHSDPTITGAISEIVAGARTGFVEIKVAKRKARNLELIDSLSNEILKKTDEINKRREIINNPKMVNHKSVIELQKNKDIQQ